MGPHIYGVLTAGAAKENEVPEPTIVNEIAEEVNQWPPFSP